MYSFVGAWGHAVIDPGFRCSRFPLSRFMVIRPIVSPMSGEYD